MPLLDKKVLFKEKILPKNVGFEFFCYNFTITK